MNQKLRIFIVEDDQDYMYLLAETLNSSPEFTIVGQAYDGESAVEGILRTDPDIVLLDLVIPKKDGICVLEELKEKKQVKPLIIMLTAIGQDRFIKMALSLGAEYYILKPYDLDFLPVRMIQIYKDSMKSKKNERGLDLGKKNNFTEEDIFRMKAEEDVTAVLKNIGIPDHVSGYLYIKQAIVETVISNQGYIPVTKELYPMIAKSYGTSSGKVERVIRMTIQQVWQRMNKHRLIQYFANVEKHPGVRPTNSEFIATVADKIRLTYLK